MKNIAHALRLTVITALLFGGALPLSAKEKKTPLLAERFCEDGEKAGRTGTLATLENKDKRTLLELVQLSSTSIRIEHKTADWKSESAALGRVTEVLMSRPGPINSLPLWAEGFSPWTQTVTAQLGKKGEKIQISGSHVCVRDGSGRFWFFRTVPVDGWKK